MRLRTLLSAALAAGAVAACSTDLGIPKATVANLPDTITLGALRSSPIGIPSAYSVASGGPVYTQGGGAWDFAFDLDSIGEPAFFPAQTLVVVPPATTNPGLQRMSIAFDSIKVAPSNGYILDRPFKVDSGDVFVARSAIACTIGVPLYGKVEILSIDSAAHTVTFKIMVNKNCGYHGLKPGIPTN